MSTPLGHTRRVRVVTFRVSAAMREELERAAEAAGVSVNRLAYRRTCAPENQAEQRVDIEESPSTHEAPRDLTVVYEDEARPSAGIGED